MSSRKNARAVNVEPDVEPPPVQVSYGTPEGGGERTGDVLVLRDSPDGGRVCLAEDLRALADVVDGTYGDPVHGYTILLVTRRRPAG